MLKTGVACAASCAIILLSACTQPAAMVQYKGQNYYGNGTNSYSFNSGSGTQSADAMPRYIPDSEPARMESPAQVSSVSVTDLAPPTPVSSAPLPPLSSNAAPAPVQSSHVSSPFKAPIVASAPALAPVASSRPIMASRDLPPPTTDFTKPSSVYSDRPAVQALSAPKTEERADIVVPAKNAPTISSSTIAPVASNAASSSVKFIWPVEGGKIISHYGPKKDGEYNDGINIAADEGEPIWAAADGTVVYSGNELKGYGNMVILRHENGWMTAYAHAKSIDAKKNAKVKQGDMIGYVGRSGGVKNAQLHFGIRNGKDPVNPELYLPRDVASR